MAGTRRMQLNDVRRKQFSGARLQGENFRTTQPLASFCGARESYCQHMAGQIVVNNQAAFTWIPDTNKT